MSTELNPSSSTPESTTPAAAGSKVERYDVLFWSVFGLLTLLGLAPVWVSDILPLLDTASHLHLMTIISNFEAEALYGHHYEQVHAIVPYLSYYKLKIRTPSIT